MAHIARTFMQELQLLFGNPKKKLRALSLEESMKKCEKIGATKKEIERARKHLTHYICERCGYHSGNVRRCPACGGWLRYWQIYERILEFREEKPKPFYNAVGAYWKKNGKTQFYEIGPYEGKFYFAELPIKDKETITIKFRARSFKGYLDYWRMRRLMGKDMSLAKERAKATFDFLKVIVGKITGSIEKDLKEV